MPKLPPLKKLVDGSIASRTRRRMGSRIYQRAPDQYPSHWFHGGAVRGGSSFQPDGILASMSSDGLQAPLSSHNLQPGGNLREGGLPVGDRSQVNVQPGNILASTSSHNLQPGGILAPFSSHNEQPDCILAPMSSHNLREDAPHMGDRPSTSSGVSVQPRPLLASSSSYNLVNDGLPVDQSGKGLVVDDDKGVTVAASTNVAKFGNDEGLFELSDSETKRRTEARSLKRIKGRSSLTQIVKIRTRKTPATDDSSMSEFSVVSSSKGCRRKKALSARKLNRTSARSLSRRRKIAKARGGRGGRAGVRSSLKRKTVMKKEKKKAARRSRTPARSRRTGKTKQTRSRARRWRTKRSAKKKRNSAIRTRKRSATKNKRKRSKAKVKRRAPKKKYSSSRSSRSRSSSRKRSLVAVVPGSSIKHDQQKLFKPPRNAKGQLVSAGVVGFNDNLRENPLHPVNICRKVVKSMHGIPADSREPVKNINDPENSISKLKKKSIKEKGRKMRSKSKHMRKERKKTARDCKTTTRKSKNKNTNHYRPKEPRTIKKKPRKNAIIEGSTNALDTRVKKVGRKEKTVSASQNKRKALGRPKVINIRRIRRDTFGNRNNSAQETSDTNTVPRWCRWPRFAFKCILNLQNRCDFWSKSL